ncbi:MAG: class I SAM-dependent methyltransferase [Planctomycetota bacterium]|jgi:SAM-dependent methyltransferase
MAEFYDDADLYELHAEGVPGDIRYFSKLAKVAGRVLDLGAGSGRVSVAMAKVGAKVAGIELSEDMLRLADKRISRLDVATAKRISLYHGDMRDFDFGRKFPLIIIPFRSFQHLMTPEDQRACLQCCHRHLTKTGRLVIDLFDPNLRILGDNLSHNGTSLRKLQDIPYKDGHITVSNFRLMCPGEQRIEEDWHYEYFSADGLSRWKKLQRLKLRYSYRFEMEHLFELEGFKVVKLEGDFRGGAYDHGTEQLWTVKLA